MTATPTRRPTARRVASMAVRGALVATAAGRVARGARRRPPLVAGGGTARDDVTVVVPARDEATRIGPCLAALVGQAGRVLVVDDGSTDGTADVARRAGADVVDAGPLPPGWAGKARALQVGLAAASTPIVVSVDADVRPGPGFVDAVADALGDATLVTVAARVLAPSAGERVVHASMLATLLYRLGPPGVPARSPGRTMANGQCMVFARERVVAAGGFEPVRGNLLEDLALARSLAGRGHEVGFVDGTGVVAVEGYGSAAAAWRGWGRSLDLAEVTSRAGQAADLAVVWAAMGLPLLRLATGRADAVDVAALALRAGAVAATRGAYEPAGWAVVAAPLADPAVAARITWGTLRPDRRWRGRNY